MLDKSMPATNNGRGRLQREKREEEEGGWRVEGGKADGGVEGERVAAKRKREQKMSGLGACFALAERKNGSGGRAWLAEQSLSLGVDVRCEFFFKKNNKIK